jgi:hypothetical protein
MYVGPCSPPRSCGKGGNIHSSALIWLHLWTWELFLSEESRTRKRKSELSQNVREVNGPIGKGRDVNLS